MNAAIAIDLGGTSIRAGRWQTGGWEATSRAPSHTAGGIAGLIDQLVATVAALQPPEACPVVLATAGTLDPATGYVHQAANLPLHDVPLRAELARRLGVPVAVVGDAWAATIGEFTAGAGQSASDGLYATISTGVGLGIVMNGHIAGGHGQQAGELGHVRVDLRPDAPRCPCGERGCLELVASGSGMVRRWHELSGESPAQAQGSAAADADPTPPSSVADAVALLALAEQGDALAAQVVDTGLTLLSACLLGLVRVFSPEVVIVGGGLTTSSFYRHHLIGRLTQSLPQPRCARIVNATCSPSSGLVGAALLAAGDPRALAMANASAFAVQLEGLLP